MRAALPAIWLLSACSLVGVERRPPLLEPDTRLTCTDSYWLPAADAVATVGASVLAVWSINRAREGCASGDPDTCDGQAGLAVLFPIPFIVSAVYGTAKVRSCRRAKEWQLDTPRPPLAGVNGSACVPVFGREGRCEQGYCVRGRCQAEIPPAKMRLLCAEAIARWRAERDPEGRAARMSEMPAGCRGLTSRPRR